MFRLLGGIVESAFCNFANEMRAQGGKAGNKLVAIFYEASPK